MWVLQPRFARPRFVRRALPTVTPRTGGATIVGTARTPEVPTSSQRLHHLTRDFGGLFILRAERFRIDPGQRLVQQFVGGRVVERMRWPLPNPALGTVRILVWLGADRTARVGRVGVPRRWDHLPGSAIFCQERHTGVRACLEQRVLCHDDAHARRRVELAHTPQDVGDVAGVHVGAPLALLLGVLGPRAPELGRSRDECWMRMHGALRCQPLNSDTDLVEGGALLATTHYESSQRIVIGPARALLLACQ